MAAAAGHPVCSVAARRKEAETSTILRRKGSSCSRACLRHSTRTETRRCKFTKLVQYRIPKYEVISRRAPILEEHPGKQETEDASAVGTDDRHHCRRSLTFLWPIYRMRSFEESLRSCRSSSVLHFSAEQRGESKTPILRRRGPSCGRESLRHSSHTEIRCCKFSNWFSTVIPKIRSRFAKGSYSGGALRESRNGRRVRCGNR